MRARCIDLSVGHGIGGVQMARSSFHGLITHATQLEAAVRVATASPCAFPIAASYWIGTCTPLLATPLMVTDREALAPDGKPAGTTNCKTSTPIDPGCA